MSRYSSSNRFASTHSDSDPDSDPDSDSDSNSNSNSLSNYVTDLFGANPGCPWDDDEDDNDDGTNINPFFNFAIDVHQNETETEFESELGLGLGLVLGDENEIGSQYNDNYDEVFNFSIADEFSGLRIVGLGSNSESTGLVEELGNGGGGDDERVDGLSWESIIHEWEEICERANENEDDESEIEEAEVEVDEQLVASEFEEEEEPGEDGLGYLEWEMLLAVNGLERNAESENENLSMDTLYLAVQDVISGTDDYDVLFGELLENESGFKGSPPAAKSFVENLPLVEMTEEDLKAKDVVCAICKDEVMVEEKVRKLPCSHFYHGDCILPWLNIRNTCPVCRLEFPTDDADYEQSKARDTVELGTLM